MKLFGCLASGSVNTWNGQAPDKWPFIGFMSSKNTGLLIYILGKLKIKNYQSLILGKDHVLGRFPGVIKFKYNLTVNLF